MEQEPDVAQEPGTSMRSEEPTKGNQKKSSGLKDVNKSPVEVEKRNQEILGDNPEEDVSCSWHDGFQLRACQRFARPSCLLLCLSLCSFTQGLVVSGFVKSAINNLELRYDLSSKDSGLIVSMYEIGCLICLIPVSYFGHWYKRSRLVSVGMFVMGIGSFVCFIPYLITEKYRYQSPVSPLCYTNNRTYPKFCNNQTLNHYKFVFWFGQFLHGAGASPLYTVGIAYLDDNLSIGLSGTYLGILYATSIIGPAVGFLLNGKFLSIYVEPGNTPSDISSSNYSLWVGAWWIGFMVSSFLCIAVSVPMFGFPKSFIGAADIRRQRKGMREAEEPDQFEPNPNGPSLNDFCASGILLLKNPTFLFLSFAGAIQLFILASLSSFGPKIFQTLFQLSNSSASTIMGFISVIAGVIGMLSGGLIMRYFNLPVGRLLWFCVASASISTLFVLGFLLKCEAQKFAGINHDYPYTPVGQKDQLTAACNANCSCQTNKFMYNPVCGADRIIYYSPCFAGCIDNGTIINGVRHFVNCSCIFGKIDSGSSQGFAAVQELEYCFKSSCKKLSFFIAMLFLLSTSIFSLSVPALQSTIRVVPAKLKDLGLGLQWVIIRLCGSIPGPTLLGLLVDNTCSLWVTGCDQRGSCSFYDSNRFSTTVLVFTLLLKVIEVLFFALAAVTYAAPANHGSIH